MDYVRGRNLHLKAAVLCGCVSVCVPLFNEKGAETWGPGSRDRSAVKYATTPFTNLNYSTPELVRASVDLVVTAVDGFKTSVTCTIKQRARVKWVGKHCRSVPSACTVSPFALYNLSV